MADPIYGQCTNCGAVEVQIAKQDGVQDLSFMGEDSKYPFGSPCEVCSHQPPGFRSATAPTNWVPGATYAQTRNLNE